MITTLSIDYYIGQLQGIAKVIELAPDIIDKNKLAIELYKIASCLEQFKPPIPKPEVTSPVSYTICWTDGDTGPMKNEMMKPKKKGKK